MKEWKNSKLEDTVQGLLGFRARRNQWKMRPEIGELIGTHSRGLGFRYTLLVVSRE